MRIFRKEHHDLVSEFHKTFVTFYVKINKVSRIYRMKTRVEN